MVMFSWKYWTTCLWCQYFYCKNFFKNLFNFYTARLLAIDLVCYAYYCCRNPFALAKKFRGEQNIYGETPYNVLAKIAAATDLNAHKTVLDLGSGRGKSCFFWQVIYGCRVIGIDWVELFINRANVIKKYFSLKNTSFIYDQLVAAPFSEVDIVYLYGTCLPEETIYQLVIAMKQLPAGAIVVSVSYPLTEYSSIFLLQKNFTVEYPWGVADIYIQQKT